MAAAVSPLVDTMRNLTIIENSLAIFGLGQMGVAIKGPDAVLYIDACLSNVVAEQFGDFWARAYPPPLLPGEVTNADYFLISHEHLDHLDPLTVGPVAKASPHAKFVAPAWCAELLAGLDIDESRTVYPPARQPISLPGTSLRLTAIPSAHYALDHDAQKGYRWLGFLIEWNGVTFYHAGDTVIYPGYIEMLKELPTPDVVIAPVNGRDWYRENDAGAVGNLLPVEAARLARDLGWGVLIPGHNDLYPNNAIPMAQIVDAISTVAPRQQVKFLQPGELYYYVKV